MATTLIEKRIKMKDIIETLKGLNVDPTDYVYLNYEEGAEVWHISDDHIENALNETEAATMLARLLATSGITVLSRYDEDILGTMRTEGLLDDYEREGTFEEYLVQKIREEAYEYDLLTISTYRHDYKRGRCDVAANVKVTAGELFQLGDDATSFVSGFDIVVQTNDGLLTLV